LSITTGTSRRSRASPASRQCGSRRAEGSTDALRSRRQLDEAAERVCQAHLRDRAAVHLEQPRTRDQVCEAARTRDRDVQTFFSFCAVKRSDGRSPACLGRCVAALGPTRTRVCGEKCPRAVRARGRRVDRKALFQCVLARREQLLRRLSVVRRKCDRTPLARTFRTSERSAASPAVVTTPRAVPAPAS
jgi:hypothetical protein